MKKMRVLNSKDNLANTIWKKKVDLKFDLSNIPLNASINTNGSPKSTGIKEGAYLNCPNRDSNFLIWVLSSWIEGCIFTMVWLRTLAGNSLDNQKHLSTGTKERSWAPKNRTSNSVVPIALSALAGQYGNPFILANTKGCGVLYLFNI